MARAVEKLHQEFAGITASKAATIAGFNNYESPYALYQRMTGNAPPQEQNFAMWLGTQMEPIVVRAFTKHTGLKCRRPRRAVDPNFWFTTEDYGFPMGCLIDGRTLDPDDTGIEAKTASAWLSGEWEEDVPVAYMCQIQHQLAVTGWSHFYAAAIVGNKYVQHRVERDEEGIALLTDKERDFYWNHFIPGVPPPVDGHESTSQAIDHQWVRSIPEASYVIEDPEVERLAMVYAAQGTAIKGLEVEREETANRLKTIVKDRESLIAGHYKISWKTQKRTSFDTKAFRAENPELAEKYTRTSETRPLKVTEVKA